MTFTHFRLTLSVTKVKYQKPSKYVIEDKTVDIKKPEHLVYKGYSGFYWFL